MRLLIALLALTLTGCAQFGMTPEQLKAAGKDGVAVCTETFSPWGRLRSVFMQIDKGVVQSGSMMIGTDCGIVFQNTPPAPPVTNVGPNNVPQPGQP